MLYTSAASHPSKQFNPREQKFSDFYEISKMPKSLICGSCSIIEQKKNWKQTNLNNEFEQ